MEDKDYQVTNRIRTVCEVIREINDVLQTLPESGQKKELKEKLDEAYGMVKRMDRKLHEYKHGYNKDWYPGNHNLEDSCKKRGRRVM